MFATLAPRRLRDNGWVSLIPAANPSKRLLTSGWEACNLAAPTYHEIDAWRLACPNAGIGFAYGPDCLSACNFDPLRRGSASKIDPRLK